jgi:hypothetical protein
VGLGGLSTRDDRPGRSVNTVIEEAPTVFVQSDGEAPVEVTSHAMDPTVGGLAGILTNGVPCRATVLAVIPLAGQKTSAGEDATGLVLSVTIADQAPFQAQTGMYVPSAALDRLAAGDELDGKALAGKNDAVAIDWNAYLGGGTWAADQSYISDSGVVST